MSTRKTISVHYNRKLDEKGIGIPLTGTHSYEHSYEPTSIFCPNCGNQHSVWRDANEGDYYVGPTYYCIACWCEFYLPQMPNTQLDDVSLQVIKKLATD